MDTGEWPMPGEPTRQLYLSARKRGVTLRQGARRLVVGQRESVTTLGPTVSGLQFTERTRMFELQNTYENLALGLILLSPLVFLVCFIRPASYGRHSDPETKLTVPARSAWILMEAPAVLFFLYFYITGPNRTEPVAVLLLAMWCLHYVHRAFIYPFRIKPRPGARHALRVVIFGGVYCSVNGFLNGYWIGHLADFSGLTLESPRLLLGLFVFACGYALNKHSDNLLAQLRSDRPGEYSVPQGGAFRWVSNPNYLGEILTWLGFAIACWSLAAFSFLLFTCANLVPRAVLNHRWYRSNFHDYPGDRRVLIPLIY